MTPDEHQYQAMGQALRHGGSFRDLATLQAPALPSPARWLWAWWVSLWPAYSPWPSRVFAILQPWSVISIWAGRRYLQDGAVSFFALAAMALARYHAGHWTALALAVAVFCLLSVKEGMALALPAVLVAGPCPSVLLAITAGCVAWFLVGAALFRGQWIQLLVASTKGHKTEYWREHQNCMPTVILGAAIMLSPSIALLPLGSWIGPAIMYFGPMSWSVQNVRLHGALEGLALLTLIELGDWWVLWFLLVIPMILFRLTAPGTGWKDSRGTVDLVPAAILEAVRK